MKKVKKHAIFPPNFHDKLSLQTEEERETIERDITSRRLRQLEEKPIVGNFDIEHLAKIHHHIFQDISSYAGSVRTHTLSKNYFSFANKETMEYIFEKEIPKLIDKLDETKDNPKQFTEAMAKLHTSLDEAHPFREGNGRSTRVFLQQLAKEKGYNLDLTKITATSEEWVEVCKKAIGCQAYSKDYKTPDLTGKIEIFQEALSPEKGQEQNLHPDTIKLKQQLEQSAEKLTPEQREVYSERAKQKLNEFNQERQQQAEQEKSQENEK